MPPSRHLARRVSSAADAERVVPRRAASRAAAAPRSSGSGTSARPPKPPCARSTFALELRRGLDHVAPRRARPASRRGRARRVTPSPSRNSSACAFTSSRRFAHASRERVEQLGEAGHPVAVRRGEVGAAEERPQVRGEEDGERPAAAAAHQLDHALVELVEVRALLAVDLHVDEALVHLRRDLPRPRTTRAPSRGTSGRPSSRSRGGSACPRARARSSASSPHGYQSTGLCACWRR